MSFILNFIELFDLNGISFSPTINKPNSPNKRVHAPGTACGGFTSLILISVVVAQTFQGLLDVIKRKGLHVDIDESALSNKELDNTRFRFGQNYKGMNIFFQYDNTKIDPFNNPYFKLKAYVSTDPNT